MNSARIRNPRLDGLRRFSQFVFLFGAAVLAVPEPALAQVAEARVRSLTRQATEAYTNLDLDRAESLLVRATSEARRRRVRGRALAEVHVVRGVIAVGGRQDLEAAAQAFDEALRADPTVEVDRMLSNPEIDAAFREAQSRAGITPRGSHRLEHTPAPEQLENTPLPIYVEPRAGLRVHQLVVRYWPEGDDETYDEAALEPLGAGYGVEVPCAAVRTGAIQYYVVALDADGQLVAQAGTEEEPLRVPVVATRTTAAPALPTRRAPEQCTAACAPGAVCDEPGSEAGAACMTDGDCGSGLSCEDEVCVEPGEALDANAGPSRFFVRGGYTLGAGYARRGGLADTGVPFHPSTRPQDFAGTYAPEGYTEAEWLTVIRERYLGYTENQDNSYPGGPLNPDADCDAPQGEFCVRLMTQGLVFVHGGDVQFGYVVLPKLALVGGVRIAASAGEGALSRFLFTGGAELRLLEPAGRGFLLALGGGLGLGQIQMRVGQGGQGVYEPFIRAGLGEMHFEVIAGYRLFDKVGIIVKPTLHGFFPERTIVAEATIGAELGF